MAAQVPQIGTIDFYGLRRVSAERLRKALGVKEGDRLPKSKGDLEEALENVNGVVRAYVEAQCCEAGKAILYVGIEEKNSPHLDLREAPTEDLALPEEITSAYAAYLDAFGRAGNKSEDFRAGHIIAEDPVTSTLQDRFVGLAELNLPLLRSVLRNSEDAEQRATAACVIGYARAKKLVVEDLQYAMRDPDPNVRLNAMRSLTAIAILGVEDPQQEIKVSPTWFVQALGSLEWKARSQAAVSLEALTDGRDENLLRQIREQALPALLEMASWKSLTHALPAYMVLGRVAGFEEKKILELWALGQRSQVLERARQLYK